MAVVRARFGCLVGVAMLFGALGAQAARPSPTLRPAELRCEYRVDPAGIDELHPRLSWLCQAENPHERGLRQQAYQIQVATNSRLLGSDHADLWDSGKVSTDQTSQIEYAGKPLASRQLCYWKVRVWDQAGTPSGWSKSAAWSMGLLQKEDWTARWIGYDEAYEPSPEQAKEDALLNTRGLKWVRFPEKRAEKGVYTSFFRRSLDLPADRQVRRAVAVLYADNACEASVNGKPIGQSLRWEKTARLDATAALHSGANVIGLKVSESDSLPPAVIGRLVVQFERGDDLVLPVDTSWKASQQPPTGWDQVGAKDADWPAAEAFDGTPWRGPAAVSDIPRMPAPYLRKEFVVEHSVRRATAYVTALGVYELHLNGKRVGQDVLTPGWTDFRKRVHYQTYDVTGQIHRGANTVGAMLGDGWYAGLLAHLARRNFYGGRPRLLLQLVLELSDGHTQTIVTDSSWKASFGPIHYADLLLGSEYDTRQTLTGWDTPKYDDKAWSPVVEGGPKSILVQASVAEPSRRHEELPARKLTEPKPGCYTFDLGQNMVGWARVKVRGAAGQRITVRHGEMLNPDGTIYTANLRSCPATDYYILDGKGEATLEPYFTFHGFRYVEIRGLSERPSPEAVTGVVIHTEMPRTGSFECSQPLVNQLYHNIIWGNKGNYLEIPTDCPQRDERMGWTGDTQFFAPTAAYNFEIGPFFTRWLTTICEDNQLPDGSFPHVSPDIMGGGGATAWGDAALLCTYNLYHAYGDTRVVATHFDAMERFMKWIAGKTHDGITNVGGFEDWLNLGGGADARAIDTAYYAHLAHIMAEMSRAIGRSAEADRYTRVFEEEKAAFSKAFLQPDGSLKNCSQTGYALAFSMGLLPADARDKSAEKYVDEIRRFDWHLATGFIGTPRLLPGLHAAGRDDIAYRLLLQESYPSWLFPVKNGATTMWERWNAWTPETGFGDVSMNSFNHYAFGSVGEYLYSGVGGISAGSPGYRTVRISPVLGDGITWAKTTFDSISGKIATDWKRSGDRLTLQVTVPPNTTATIAVPSRQDQPVTESGQLAAQVNGIKFLRWEKGAALFEVGSGTYTFGSQL